jgi:uncharacterized protein YbjT (DUF2867 family)
VGDAQGNRVLVIGATGTIGSEVVSGLRAAEVPVRALSRDPARARLPAGVEVMAGDLAAPESLDAALRGVETVFLVWTAGPETVREVIGRIARSARRLVLLSSPHQTPHPLFSQPNPMAEFHAAIEREVAASGIAATVLRPGMFAANAAAWWGPQARDGSRIRWPYPAAASAPVDERDVGDVAARVLADPAHAGGDYVLTGPESLTHAEQVALIAGAIGRRLVLEEMPPDEFREMLAASAPPAVAEMLLNAWRASVGIPAYVTHTVAEITGRAPRTFGEWAADHARVFQPANA